MDYSTVDMTNRMRNSVGEAERRDGGNSLVEENQSYTRTGPWQRIFDSIIPADVQSNPAERRRFNEAIKNAKADMETSFDFSKKWSSYNKADQRRAVETFKRNLVLKMNLTDSRISSIDCADYLSSTCTNKYNYDVSKYNRSKGGAWRTRRHRWTDDTPNHPVLQKPPIGALRVTHPDLNMIMADNDTPQPGDNMHSFPFFSNSVQQPDTSAGFSHQWGNIQNTNAFSASSAQSYAPDTNLADRTIQRPRSRTFPLPGMPSTNFNETNDTLWVQGNPANIGQTVALPPQSLEHGTPANSMTAVQPPLQPYSTPLTQPPPLPYSQPPPHPSYLHPPPQSFTQSIYPHTMPPPERLENPLGNSTVHPQMHATAYPATPPVIQYPQPQYTDVNAIQSTIQDIPETPERWLINRIIEYFNMKGSHHVINLPEKQELSWWTNQVQSHCQARFAENPKVPPA